MSSQPLTAASPLYRVGVDIGGTFTDLSIIGTEGIVASGKVLTSHRAPANAVEKVLRQALTENRIDPGQISGFVHGTTLVTNALIERRGSTTALITTEGFRDVVEMGREHRYELYDLNIDMPRPLVPRWLRFGVRERILADGSVDTPLDLESLRSLGAELSANDVEAVAICFLHSHINPEHEIAAQEVLTEVAPGIRVAISSQINPEIREYERASTTIANVYVQETVQNYLTDLAQRLRRLGLEREPLIMLSNGGVAAISVAASSPIRMLESGPAGGALGAVAFGRANGITDQLAFDMGGTTAKLCLIEDSRPLVTHTFEINRLYRLRAGSGLPVRAPVIDMIEIGAGGGSIARVNALGLITIGPDSAGSEPGPVCYGTNGTQCTVTDADLVLGYLSADSFLGGRMSLDVEAARRAICEQIATPMRISVEEAAWGIHTTVNEDMANAARVHAMERGHNPTELPLFVSGGNGPLHGPGVARALGCRALTAPPAAGVLSTLGFLSAPMAIDMVRSHHVELTEGNPQQASTILTTLAEEGRQTLEDSGADPGQLVHEYLLDMRFIGQGAEVSVEVAAPNDGDLDWFADVERKFRDTYRARFGSVSPVGVGPEILTWRVTTRGPDPHARLRLVHSAPQSVDPAPQSVDPAPQSVHSASVSTADSSGRIAYTGRDSASTNGARDARQLWFGGFISTPVFHRSELSGGTVISGPAVVEESESTLIVPPGARCRVRADDSIWMEFDGCHTDTATTTAPDATTAAVTTTVTATKGESHV